MPPKKKHADARGEEEFATDGDSVAAVGQPESPGSWSAGSSTTVTTEHLQLILESNQRAMASLISSMGHLPSATPAPVHVTAPPKKVTIPVPRWDDDDNPSEFFTTYEQAQAHNAVEKTVWGTLLPVYLTGKAKAAYFQLEPSLLTNYVEVKNQMLIALGDTPAEAGRKWWTTTRNSGEEIGAFAVRLRSIGMRMFDGADTRDEVVERAVLSRFLYLLPSDCYTQVSSQKPKTCAEASRMVHEFESTKTFSRRRQYWKPDSNHQPYHSGRREPTANNSSGSPNSGSSPNPTSSGQNQGQVSSPGNVDKGGSSGKSWKRERKPIVCYGCREPGHIRPDCPNKVKRVVSPVQEVGSDESLITAWIGGKKALKAEVDTACDRTVVHPDYIPQGALLEGTCVLRGYQGHCKTHQLAKVTIGVGSVSDTLVVAVDENLEHPALLGKDLSWEVKSEMLSLVKLAVDKKVEEVKQGTQAVCVTRAQARKSREQEQADEVATAESECQPTGLGEIFEFDDSMFESEAVPTQVEDLVVWPEASVLDLPNLGVGQGNKGALAKEQASDISLGKALEAARKEEKGFCFVDGILVHEVEDGFMTVSRIVVPSSRREQVLRATHTNLTAGHFGYKRTLARIARYFMWPGMWKEVRQFVRTCGGCQRAARNTNAKAPLQPLPVVSEPFTKVAFDIVGPLPRTTSGYKYLLTMICLFTKFPVAIPLRRVDNETVLNAMMEVFSTYGIPREILTDQGSVFTSKLTRHLCKTLNIDKVQISPYHPQSNGSLERWHACLKSMLRKAGGNLKEWDCTLKYLLLAYRDSPHSVTGFSPFTLMFGREVRGPLELLRTSWVDEDVEDCNVSEWLVGVKLKMAEMAELVSDRERVAKTKMKKYYDKPAKAKHFDVGEMVLVRRPALHGKFERAWDGPFQVGKVVSPVTYLIQRPGHSSRSKVIHANLLRKWVTPVDSIHRVAFIQEEDGECQTPPGLRLAREDFVPSPEQELSLQAVLKSFEDVLCSTPGRTKELSFSMNTGDHDPVSGPPYRIPPKWKEEVKRQVDELLRLGIIVPSVSPWASSVVTVKKKDGGVRICVDYRAINACTLPDPYLMPLIEEILDTLAPARFISKIDLNKGFHQIPVKPEDAEKTAFCTPWGKFQFQVMPFGVRNGPATFQRLMDRLLHQDLDISRVYIDDIAVFSSSWDAHCKDIARVLGRLRQAGLTANVAKCQWGQTACEFLGHIVGKGKVSPADLKVRAVKEFVFPQTKRQVRQFLGLTGYYRRFIPKYSEHAYCLTEATRKLAPDRVKRTDALVAEFSYLKEMLCAMPLLTLPVPSDSFVLQTDASGVGLGAVLSVRRGEEELPVAFHSRKLQPREQRYSASELECLAVVDAVKHFGGYLIPQTFLVETDHKALTYLQTANHQNGRLARWALQLQPYDFTIRYRAGKDNGNADALSRRWEDEGEPISSPTTSHNSRGGGDVERSLPRTTTSNMEPQAEPQAVAQAVPLEEPGRATGKLRQS